MGSQWTRPGDSVLEHSGDSDCRLQQLLSRVALQHFFLGTPLAYKKMKTSRCAYLPGGWETAQTLTQS